MMNDDVLYLFPDRYPVTIEVAQASIGGHAIALLRQGEAVVLQAGVAHRVHQHGPQPCTVGVALRIRYIA